jgi:glutathione S-transferase
LATSIQNSDKRDGLTLFHSPSTRSSGALALLEELGASYDVHLLNMKKGEQRSPDFLKVNPMGKVPAIDHNGAIITEQVAIYLYLADLFPAAALAPRIGDPQRGPYLKWMAFYGSCFEPAIVDRYLKREPGARAMSPYGDFDTVLTTITQQLEKGQWLLGEKFYAIDLLWGSALGWMTMFGLVPLLPVIKTYVENVAARPAVKRAKEKDAAFLAAQG